MTERWTFHGPANNIHVCLADDGNQRVCFLTSDGPTVERARLIAAAPELLSAAQELSALADSIWAPMSQQEAILLHTAFGKLDFAIRKATEPRP